MGYAYTATVESQNNAIKSDYITVSIDNKNAAAFVSATTGTANFQYDTTTLADKIEYKYVSGTITSKDIKITKTDAVNDEVSIKMSISKSDLKKTNANGDVVDYINLFYNGTSYANVKIAGQIAAQSSDETSITWTLNSYTMSSNEVTFNAEITGVENATVDVKTPASGANPGLDLSGLKITFTIGPEISTP